MSAVMLSDEDRVRSALGYLDPSDRALWVKMAFAVKSEFGEDGCSIWADWGEGYKRPASEITATWRSASEGGAVRINTLIWEAKQAGWKDDTKYQKPTAAEIAAREQRQAQRLAAEAAAEAEEHARGADWAQRLWNAATPADDVHPYLTRKQVKAHKDLKVGKWERIDEATGEFIVVAEDALLVPIFDRNKNLRSLQMIPAKTGGAKYMLRGGAKSGNFFDIGTPQTIDGRKVFMFGEGFATCASAHEATGHMVLVCFDRTNLLTVAQQVRGRHPEAVLLFLADNDLDKPDNPGLTDARKAAKAVGGLVAVPVLSATPEQACDFNDLHCAEGLETVRTFVDAALLCAGAVIAAPAAAEAPIAPPTATTPMQDATHAAALPAHSSDPDDDLAASASFLVLGFRDDTYYLFDRQKRAVLPKTRRDFSSDIGLVEIAPLNWWEMHFGTPKGGIDRTRAAEWIFGLARRRGVYSPTRTRCRGAWRDKGRLVFHHGEHLTVDGQRTEIEHVGSRFVYPASIAMPEAPLPGLSDVEGQGLLDVARMVRWANPASAQLLAGWTFLAPVCGVLQWRPHIWLTGAAGSGKSTILRAFAGALLRDVGPLLGGGSTEAGVRQALAGDALPVLLDEFEPNEEGDRRRMSAMLSTIRTASSEGATRTVKGTVAGAAMAFDVRSMFCLASINTMLDKDSDNSRITALTIRPPNDGSGVPDRWAELEDALHGIEKNAGDLSARLLTRAVAMMPLIIQNADMFADAVSQQLRSERYGDQFGTLLAGSWCLTKATVATPAEAAAIVRGIEWRDFLPQADEPDSERCLQAILGSKIVHKGTSVSVRTLLALVLGMDSEGLQDVDRATAKRLLQENGLTVSKRLYLAIAYGHASITALLRDTRFSTDWGGQLKRVQGYEGLPSTSFGPGLKNRAHGIPLVAIGMAEGDDEPPI